MLLTLLGNLGMFGGNVPPPTPPAPPPVNIAEGGAYNGRRYSSDEQYLLDREREYRIREEDEMLIQILKIWAKKCQ